MDAMDRGADGVGKAQSGWPVSAPNEGRQAVVDALGGGATDWLIVCHERPDGDAIGSALGMACLLEQLGKRWTVLIESELSPRFRFLPHADAVETAATAKVHAFQAVVAVDCADRARFAYAEPWIAANAVVVNVDHHPTNPRYGTACWVDSRAAATCELVFHLAQAMGVVLTADLARCLYTGIVTDTGSFAQQNTTRCTHQIAADLLAAGVRPDEIAGPVMEARSWRQTQLLQRALAHIQLSPDGLFSWLCVTRAMYDETGCTEDDSEGFVNFPRAIESVEVAAMFRETPDDRVKVSLRSKRCVDVAQVAQTFAGGGHVRAAGCVLDAPLSAAVEAVQFAVNRAIREAMPCIQAYWSSTSRPE
ncbi:MAG: bifunctional oligoribonuclease/PAP phosphatase NrnA [Alicyclobacillus sp.]|nr:bifunctional oligoribonuclease/PAP phosphatase NrnA [Alicyclobacillus sp.]